MDMLNVDMHGYLLFYKFMSFGIQNKYECYVGQAQNWQNCKLVRFLFLFGLDNNAPVDDEKVCYDVLIDINGMTYICTGCDTLVYNPNSYQWEAMMARPVGITELELNTINDDRMYDLLGRELFEVPKGTIYIKNRKKFIR